MTINVKIDLSQNTAVFKGTIFKDVSNLQVGLAKMAAYKDRPMAGKGILFRTHQTDTI